MGNVKTGVILKDVSLDVHAGEVLAVLGSKGKFLLPNVNGLCPAFLFALINGSVSTGSGKRALLDVMARREQGLTRGQILLNGAPMSLRLFQQSCAYVSHKCDILPGLSVEQALHYAASLTVGSKVRV